MSPHVLDEIAIADPDSFNGLEAELAAQISQSMGAIVEYEFHRRNDRPELPKLSAHSPSTAIKAVESLLAGARATWTVELGPVDFDVMTIPDKLDRDPTWVAFIKRSESTACSAGISPLIAAGVAGAIGELADNVMQHSDAPRTGLAAFARRPGGFEYVVADAGIGMLTSLRKHEEYRSVRDDMEAIPLAVVHGMSRFGRGLGRGFGFRAVLAPLRALSGTVRVRSGEAVLQVVGDGQRGDEGRCSQRPPHRGVVVAGELIHNSYVQGA